MTDTTSTDHSGTRLLVQTGGAVQGDRAYVRRAADDDLPKAMCAGELCVLFAPRQEGKTSLMNRTLDELSQRGIRCALFDIGLVGPKDATVGELFGAFGAELGELFETPFELDDGPKTPPSQFVEWLVAMVGRSEGQFAIFIDEIHQLLEAPALASALLEVLRVIHERRARSPELGRLSFCVAGVTRPRDLVAGSNPLEDARVILLEDFKESELAALAPRFPSELLQWVHHWTHGHPYMTAQLLRDATETAADHADASIERLVAAVVERTLLMDESASERYLTDARWLFGDPKRFGGADLRQAIEVYRRLLRGELVKETDAGPSGVVLTLCGVAAPRARDGLRVLEPRNRVIARLYGERWLQEQEVNKYLDLPLQKWAAESEATGYLLRGDALEVAIGVAKRAADITQQQRRFLLASIEENQRHAASEQRAPLQETISKLEASLRATEREQSALVSNNTALTGKLEEQTATIQRIKRQRWRTLALLAVVTVALVIAQISNSRRVSRLEAKSLDDELVVKNLRAAADEYAAGEINRKKTLDEYEERRLAAVKEAEELKKIADGAKTDKEEWRRKADLAKAAATKAATAVDGARRDYELARRASEEARARADQALESLDNANIIIAGLKSELAQRQSLEILLAKEQARCSTLESERDRIKSEGQTCQAKLDKCDTKPNEQRVLLQQAPLDQKAQ